MSEILLGIFPELDLEKGKVATSDNPKCMKRVGLELSGDMEKGNKIKKGALASL